MLLSAETFSCSTFCYWTLGLLGLLLLLLNFLAGLACCCFNQLAKRAWDSVMNPGGCVDYRVCQHHVL